MLENLTAKELLQSMCANQVADLLKIALDSQNPILLRPVISDLARRGHYDVILMELDDQFNHHYLHFPVKSGFSTILAQTLFELRSASPRLGEIGKRIFKLQSRNDNINFDSSDWLIINADDDTFLPLIFVDGCTTDILISMKCEEWEKLNDCINGVFLTRRGMTKEMAKTFTFLWLRKYLKHIIEEIANDKSKRKCIAPIIYSQLSIDEYRYDDDGLPLCYYDTGEEE